MDAQGCMNEMIVIAHPHSPHKERNVEKSGVCFYALYGFYRFYQKIFLSAPPG